jgi:pilus assembly protein CpaB
MNRRTRTLIVMAIAIVCASAASWGVYYAVSHQKPPEEQVDVIVAARKVTMGICLGEDDIKIARWPKSTVVEGMLSDKTKVLQRGLMTSLLENEPLTETKMAKPKEGCGLLPKIKEKMRAISVKVNEVIGVAGFVLPGAHVDVLVTIRESENSASRVVVSNAEVLTAGTSFDQEKAKDGKPVPTTVVTLMVDPSDAERIALAATEGQILLTLRNPLDQAPTRTTGITRSVLMDSGVQSPVPEPRPKAPTGSTTTRITIEKIASGKVTREVVNR